ncbi:B-cell differentiation antigen CD72 isoform X1 [Trichosurus vulpecula]|uniref:B-cell differentiation antigen CD72 isoform X1 n=1 Tax=Trichosurus vulpecula TaxID=9337 RepID=UPI00186B30CB|nr:B-cell differentiation antigen CD72 isoform X1 [Trichosurus vulpecula]
MAESITYADLRFVKSPLKKTLSAKLKQVPEVDEDGELTYENVQVPSAKDVFPSPAQPGLGGQTGGEKTEKPVATPYSVTSPIARRILPCPVAWTPYILLSLLGTCLLLGVTTISLGIQYMQISHQLRNTKQVLEVTNGSLLQQLQIGAIQLSRKEKDLHAAREELAQTQQNLEVEKGQHQAAEDYLLTCRSEKNKTELSLKDNMEEKRNLEEKLKTLQNGLKQVRRLLPCLFQSNGQESRHPHQFPDYYCPLGWTQFEGKCLYISSSQKTWKQSNSFCQSLSSKLFVLSSRVEKDSIMEILKREKILNDIWIQGWQWNNKRDQDHNTYQCATLNRPYSYYSTFESCNKSLLFMCEKEAITRPVELEDYLCH